VVVCAVIGAQFVAFRQVAEAIVEQGDLPRRAGVWWIGTAFLAAGVIVSLTDVTSAVSLAAGLALLDNALLNASVRAGAHRWLCPACVGVAVSVPLLTSLPMWVVVTGVVTVAAGAAVIAVSRRARDNDAHTGRSR
jgi:hypothetical protein